MRFVAFVLTLSAVRAFISGAPSATLIRSSSHRSSSSQQRSLFDPLGIDYVPRTQVTDFAAIGLDHLIIETLLKGGTLNLAIAKETYEQGASSFSYAEVILDTPLEGVLEAGTVVVGASYANVGDVMGTVLETVDTGSDVVKIRYSVRDDQANYLNCRVGGAPEPFHVLDECLSSNGTLAFGSGDGNSILSYKYDVVEDNHNGRTFQSFSTLAADVLASYPTFQKHVAYFGQPDYADHIVLVGFDSGTTDLKNGNVDFTGFSALGEEHGEVLRKSIVTLHTAMWIVGKLEVANEACIEGCTQIDCYGDSVSSWDQAVALYFGTNTGEQMSYHDADKYCKYFGTCGENQEILEGTAQINYKVMDLYRMGQSMIVEGRCSELLSIKEQIETLMIVPNIQGTLRNIWKGHDNNMKGETAKIEKHRGEAIAYTLALLPLVHACSAADAELVYTTIFTADLNLESYQVVKDALEKNYDCLGVECSDVGGFTGKSAEGYMDFHLPCGVILEESSSSDEDQLQASMAKEETSSSKLGVGLGVGIPLGLALLGVIAWTATKRTKSEPIKGDSMTASDVEASEPSVKHPEKSIN